MRGRCESPEEPTLVWSQSLEVMADVRAEAPASELLLTATRELTKLLGERGSCILLEGHPRVGLAPHAPDVVDQPVDLHLYPEVAAAAEHGDLIVIEDVHADARLEPVRGLLPRTLGTVAVVPLVIGKRCPAVFLIQSDRARRISREAKTTARLVARFTAALLARGEGLDGHLLVPAEPHATAPGLVTACTHEVQRQILIVEDDPVAAQALAEILKDEGFGVRRATDGADGVAIAVATHPHLVLLDVRLPRMDGFEAAARMRASAVTADVPILFLSAADDLAARVRAAHIDNVDFMPKPILADELLARIERALVQASTRAALQERAEHDELTGLGNLRLFRARMANEHARFARYGSPLSLVVLDVDKMKRINDEHGHLAGSQALQAIAEVLRREARETDVPARYGGDEFVVLLPQTTLVDASAFSRRVLEQIAHLDPGGVPVTASIGVASLSVPGSTESADHLLGRADAAAYCAKHKGGNGICLDENEPARSADGERNTA
jgi:two-component system cell cycle response regulator